MCCLLFCVLDGLVLCNLLSITGIIELEKNKSPNIFNSGNACQIVLFFLLFFHPCPEILEAVEIFELLRFLLSLFLLCLLHHPPFLHLVTNKRSYYFPIILI